MTTEQYSIGYEAGYQDGWNEAQKPFIGLTDEEREQVINTNTATGLWHMAKDIEAKLKEKNT